MYCTCHVSSLLYVRTRGSTCGVLASIIACVQWHNSRLQPVGAVVQSNRAVDPRDLGTGAGALTQPVQPPPLLRRSVVILPRDAHKSAVHALVLSGATPCFLPPLRHPKSGIGLGISRVSLEAALVEHGEEVRVSGTGSGRRWEGGKASQISTGSEAVKDEKNVAQELLRSRQNRLTLFELGREFCLRFCLEQTDRVLRGMVGTRKYVSLGGASHGSFASCYTTEKVSLLRDSVSRRPMKTKQNKSPGCRGVGGVADVRGRLL